MEKIPNEIMTEILTLRSENGLEATEAAAYADLTRSKATWWLTEKLRYRKAGRSPLYISGRYLSAHGIDPATGERDLQFSMENINQSGPAIVSNTMIAARASFFQLLHEKGFAVKITRNLVTREIETKLPPSIEKLGLIFKPIPVNTADIHIIQIRPQIQIAMPLDRFLELAGIEP